MSQPTFSLEDARAVRRDEAIGITEEAELFDDAGTKVFGCRSIPRGDPVGAVVICPTLLAESIRNYRREVLLARELAVSGFAVQRFHYQGSGNSEGSSSEVTIDAMLSNALTARESLIARTGVTRVAFMGTRWGALIAGRAAARFERASLILWEPILDPAGYFRDAFRSQLVYELKKRSSAAPSTDALIRELRSSGSVDILGWSLHETLYASALGYTIEQEVGDGPRAILLMQIGRALALRRDFALLVDRWRQRGLSVQTEAVQEQPDWWFSGEHWAPDETRDSTKKLTRTTVDWMIRVSRAGEN